ncbi:uncharacterized protein IAS62_005867 [Cryptococcus decagattii]|uniref:Uncharacterized protein n=1 Tax=Cryptococcus decagattii TaxID=1859122 RepID=A0ABZ2B247_9TREE
MLQQEKERKREKKASKSSLSTWKPAESNRTIMYRLRSGQVKERGPFTEFRDGDLPTFASASGPLVHTFKLSFLLTIKN